MSYELGYITNFSEPWFLNHKMGIKKKYFKTFFQRLSGTKSLEHNKYELSLLTNHH